MHDKSSIHEVVEAYGKDYENVKYGEGANAITYTRLDKNKLPYKIYFIVKNNDDKVYYISIVRLDKQEMTSNGNSSNLGRYPGDIHPERIRPSGQGGGYGSGKLIFSVASYVCTNCGRIETSSQYNDGFYTEHYDFNCPQSTNGHAYVIWYLKRYWWRGDKWEFLDNNIDNREFMEQMVSSIMRRN